MKDRSFRISNLALMLAFACLAGTGARADDSKDKYPVDAAKIAAEQGQQFTALPPKVQKVRMFMYQIMASRLNATHNAGVFSDYLARQNCAADTTRPDTIQKDAETALNAWFNAEREIARLEVPPGLDSDTIDALEQAKRSFIDVARTNEQFAMTYADAVLTRAKGDSYEADLKVVTAAGLANTAKLVNNAAVVHLRSAARSIGDKDIGAYM